MLRVGEEQKQAPAARGPHRRTLGAEKSDGKTTDAAITVEAFALIEWDDEELQVASILLELAKKRQLPGKEDGVDINARKKRKVSGGITDEKRKRIIVIPPKPQRQSSTSTGATSSDGFPFLIVSFLSAVRVALITPSETKVGIPAASGNYTQEADQTSLPSLTFDQIMQRVRSNPGDGRVLEMPVRFQDLVRGVLRIFLSGATPPGLPWWSPLVVYKKNTKLWSWVGPLPNHWPRADDIIRTSPQAWGMSGFILNRLVDYFGEWLNSTLGVLQQIASLPPPPLSLMPKILPGERYTQTRNLKNSVLTIGPSCVAVRAYFQIEETLRYSIPEQAFTYTTRDGMKSKVVPLKKCSGKPSKKAREHSILKADRPPYFTVLCVVRDAAARLPHRSGTRSDICTLVRDSQFVKEDAADCDIKQVVLGALDRLHYEVDPCIRFDREQSLWCYLHGDKEEEDFDENCTASGKRRGNQ